MAVQDECVIGAKNTLYGCLAGKGGGQAQENNRDWKSWEEGARRGGGRGGQL